MAEKALSDVFDKLEEQKTAIVENLEEAFAGFVNNPPDGNEETQFQNTGEAELARGMEQLVLKDQEPLMFDETKNFLEFVGILRQEIANTQQLIAVKQARNEQLKTEIEFYKSNLSSLKAAVEEFKTKEKAPRKMSQRKRLQRAQAKFSELEKQMKHFLKALYPKQHAGINDVLDRICAQYFADGGTDYVEIDANVNSGILETLLASKIIAAHPHQKNLFKLSL